MAKIVEITYNSAEQTRRKVSNVHCIWKTGELEDGTPCVILGTCNPHTKNGTVTQVLHITPDIAKNLIGIFEKELLNK